MSGIKFSHLTKEIELKGSESFIESNFDKILELFIASFGVKKKKKMKLRSTMTKQEPLTRTKMNASQTMAKMGRQASFDAAQSSIMMTSMPHISHEKANRPPVRKYIRKVGIPGQERVMVEAIEQKPKELSLAQLKEKFGLSELKKGRTIRHAQKQG